MPVSYTLLGRVPAEEDHAPLALVREVEQANVQVFKDDAELPNALYRQVEFVRLNALLGAYPPAAVRARGPQDRLEVRGPLAQGVAVERDVRQELTEPGEK